MNEALNIRISATKTSNSVSSSPLPFSSHVHLVSVKDSPTAFLFAHFVHECLKIQRNDTNEDEDDFDDDENNKDEDNKNETTRTTKTSSLRTKRKRASSGGSIGNDMIRQAQKNYIGSYVSGDLGGVKVGNKSYKKYYSNPGFKMPKIS